MSTPNDPVTLANAVKAAIFSDRKIEAIKLYREQTSVGLAEAKAAVEKLEAELRQSSPESFSAPAKPSGCSHVLLTVAALAFAVGLAVRHI